MSLSIASLLLLPSLTLANTLGADALLQATDKNAPRSAVTVPGATPSFQAFSFKDPFSLQLFATWQATPKMPYAVDQWVKKVLEQDIEGAAHLWTQVAKEMPANFLPTGELTQAYLLWKLDLAQEFLDTYLQAMKNPAQRESKLMMALQQSMDPTFANWILEKAVLLKPEQARSIQEEWGVEVMGPVADTLRAYAMLRTGIQNRELALKVLDRLPVNHPLKIPFAETVSLGFARAELLADAGKILKSHLEPSILASKRPELLSGYYLQIARLLYQADSLDAAEAFYKKIPSGRPEFLIAREELGWILLRRGELSQLKGEVKNFRLGLTEDKFLPETYVVSAVANLKLCRYKQVQEDINAFASSQKVWAEKVQKEMVAANPQRPLETNFFISLADRAVDRRSEELNRLKDLSQRSINAALPAVGVQAHWEQAAQRQRIALELAEKNKIEEYRQVWKNWHAAIEESIRKMKFVKVELLSQLTELTAKQGGTAPLENSNAKVALQQEKDAVVFPFDGVVWNDEVFHLRAVTEGVCL